jgi:LysR family nitrogen assimilation transcriptional regulator
VANGRIDVGILYEETVSSAFDVEPLWCERYVVVSGRARGFNTRRSISFEEVAKHPLILPGRPHAMRLKVDEVATKLNLDLNIVLQIDGLNSILDLVHKGVGVSILTPPALYGYQANAEMVVTPLTDPVISSRVVAVCSKQHPITNTVRTLLRIVQDEGQKIRKTGRADIQSVRKICGQAVEIPIGARCSAPANRFE